MHCDPADERASRARVDDGDSWIRVITNRTHITRDKTIHASHFKMPRAFGASSDGAWDHEVSGRLRSRIVDVNALLEDARAREEAARNSFLKDGKVVPSHIGFAGIAVSPAGQLVAVNRSFTSMVVYSPLPIDAAHADWVARGTANENVLVEAKGWLAAQLKVVLPDEVPAEPLLFGSSAPPAGQ